MLRLLPSLVGAVLLLATALPCLADATRSGARVDQALTVRVDGETITLELGVTLNRPAAFAEVLKIDADGDGRLATKEQARYFAAVGQQMLAGLEVRVDGRTVPLRPVGDVALEMPFTKRFRFTVDANRPPHEDVLVEVFNDNFLEFDGSVTTALEPGPETDVVLLRSDIMASDDGPVDDAEPARATLVALDGRSVQFRCGAGTGRITRTRDVDAPARLADAPTPGAARTGVDPRVAALLAAAVFALVVALPVSRRRRSIGLLLGAALLAVAVAVPLRTLAVENAPITAVTEAEAKSVFGVLHATIYRALEATDEQATYDRLAEGVDASLRESMYLEILAARTDTDGEAKQVNVHRVRPIETYVLPAETGAGSSAFRIRHRWRVVGTVTHFGHRHARTSEYAADYTVAPRDGRWRIVAAELLECDRVDPGTREASRTSTQDSAG